MSKQSKQEAARSGSYKARVRRNKREEYLDGRIAATLADMGIITATLAIARHSARRRKVKP